MSRWFTEIKHSFVQHLLERDKLERPAIFLQSIHLHHSFESRHKCLNIFRLHKLWPFQSIPIFLSQHMLFAGLAPLHPLSHHLNLLLHPFNLPFVLHFSLCGRFFSQSTVLKWHPHQLRYSFASSIVFRHLCSWLETPSQSHLLLKWTISMLPPNVMDQPRQTISQ